MPRRCSICTHSRHRAIDEAIVAGEPFRRIASHFEISEAAVRRHRAHVGAKITKAAQARESAEGATLLDRLETLRILTELARLATRSASPQVAPLTSPVTGDPDRVIPIPIPNSKSG